MIMFFLYIWPLKSENPTESESLFLIRILLYILIKKKFLLEIRVLLLLKNTKKISS